ncbi:MAG: hypothetical protein AABX53_00820 [Nanoarchaeota archaeon]
MRTLKKEEIAHFIDEAVKTASYATCIRARCGCVIVQKSEIIGKGYNSPPNERESQRRCSQDKSKMHPKITDKTCCIHAEQRAIIDAIKKNPDKIEGSQLLFVRLDSKGEIAPAGEPYCTQCSKMALDVGIKEFILLHATGPIAYEAEEYNKRSYQYGS